MQLQYTLSGELIRHASRAHVGHRVVVQNLLHVVVPATRTRRRVNLGRLVDTLPVHVLRDRIQFLAVGEIGIAQCA